MVFQQLYRVFQDIKGSPDSFLHQDVFFHLQASAGIDAAIPQRSHPAQGGLEQGWTLSLTKHSQGKCCHTQQPPRGRSCHLEDKTKIYICTGHRQWILSQVRRGQRLRTFTTFQPWLILLDPAVAEWCAYNLTWRLTGTTCWGSQPFFPGKGIKATAQKASLATMQTQICTCYCSKRVKQENMEVRD